jgi:hypothetical protein
MICPCVYCRDVRVTVLTEFGFVFSICRGCGSAVDAVPVEASPAASVTLDPNALRGQRQREQRDAAPNFLRQVLPALSRRGAVRASLKRVHVPVLSASEGITIAHSVVPVSAPIGVERISGPVKGSGEFLKVVNL